MHNIYLVYAWDNEQRTAYIVTADSMENAGEMIYLRPDVAWVIDTQFIGKTDLITRPIIKV